MPITKKAGRQATSVAEVDFSFADFGASGTAEVAIDIPSGAIVLGGFIQVKTVFNSATSDALDVGDVGTPARYKGAVNAQALGATALIPTGLELVNGTGDITIEWTGVGAAPTTGAGKLVVEYIQTNRADYIQR